MTRIKEVNIPWPKIFLGLAVVATVAGALFATKTLSSIEKNIAAAKEAARPANIRLTKITTPNCNNCFNVDSVLATLKKQNVTVGEEKTVAFDSEEAQALVKKLGIKRLPTYIFTGEVNKSNLESFVKINGEVKNNTFIFTKVTPIFIDPETGKKMGLVDITYLTDSTCSDCYDPIKVQKPILTGGYGVGISSERTVDINSGAGQSLVNQYKITKIPTILLSSGADQYVNLKNVWKNVGTVESDGFYVFRQMQQLGNVVYKDLASNKVIRPSVASSSASQSGQ